MQKPNDGTTDAADPPARFDDLQALLVQRVDELPPRLRQCAAYALNHPDKIALSTVSEIAEAADVQPSALIRFAQSLGYQGFSELQRVFRSRLAERWPDYQDRLNTPGQEARSGAAALLDGFADTAMRSLMALREQIDPQALESAVDALARADIIYVLGLRRSLPVAAYLSYIFGKMGIRSQLLDGTGGMVVDWAAQMRQSDRLVAISFDPYTPDTLAVAERAHDRGIPVVSITDGPLSPIARR